MKIILSNPTGNTTVRAAANGLLEADLLAKLHVSVAVFSGSLMDRLSYFTPFSAIRRRMFNPELKPYTRSWPWLEFGRHLATRAGFSKLINQEGRFFNVNSVNMSLDKFVASGLKYAAAQGLSAIYCVEDVAMFSFRSAKNLGVKCLYELPVGYWRAMHRFLEVERERWPEWIPTLTGFHDSAEKLARKDEELQLADVIFVASSFSKSTLQDFPGLLTPVKIIPFGFPPINNNKRSYSNLERKKSLKLLFVGSLSQRKGIADLFAAVEPLKDYVELTVIGTKPTGNKCHPLDAALAKHKWIPTLPHSEVLKVMQEHDVLIFPSLFEGFGLVITEAMSQGMTVITTDRTVGPDIIKNGENGWLIKAGSTEVLQEAIENILNHPETITKVGRGAIDTASKRPWHIYGQELAETIERILKVN